MKSIATVLLLLFAAALFAQGAAEHTDQKSGEFWICPILETAMYSPVGLAFGGGLAIGYSKGSAAMGLKAEYLSNTDGLKSLEINFLLRWHLSRNASKAPLFGWAAEKKYSGPFLQFTGGPVLFAPFYSDFAVPSEFGNISAGLCFGWRFLFGSRWFVEPAVRAGYPYIAGAGVYAGVRF